MTGGPFKQAKQRVDALDEANFTIKYTTYEGDGVLKSVQKSVQDVRIVDSGNGRSIFKVVAEVNVHDDNLVKGGHLEEAQETELGVLKLLEAHLHANPNLYA